MSARGSQRFLLALVGVSLVVSSSFGGFFGLFRGHCRPPMVLNQEYGYFPTQWAPWPVEPPHPLPPEKSASKTPPAAPAAEPEPELIPAPKVQGPPPNKSPYNPMPPDGPR